MASKFAGKTVFVTGGSQGIGRAACEAFLEKGMKVCIADVNVQVGEKAVGELKAKYGEENVMFLKCDVSSETEFEESVLTAKRKLGHLDILVNNAGIVLESNWEKTIDVNVKGVMRGTMLAFKHLSDKDGKQGGTVVNTASVLAFLTESLIPAYTSSKFAVGAWTRCWGDEVNVRRTNVKVVAVCPDATDTEMAKKGLTTNSVDADKGNKLVDAFINNILKPADIANGFIKVIEEDVSGALLSVRRKQETGIVEMKYVECAAYSP